MAVEPIVLLSALEHHMYCPRQCALIHVDGVWQENPHTVRGSYGHRRVDTDRPRMERGVKMLRGIPLWSEELGLSGRADAVEVHPDGSLLPVEYKIGSPHGRAAAVQLCAQALCLEEMMSTSVPAGVRVVRRTPATTGGCVRRRSPLPYVVDHCRGSRHSDLQGATPRGR
ncbi:MAG: CRISPR-associated protein Cas4 [Actinomycetota bacterium]